MGGAAYGRWIEAERTRVVLGAVVVPVALAAATAIVHEAGGSKTVFPHLYYLPIVVAAIAGGPVGGLACALVAGVLAGPLTPLDTDAQTEQALSSWLVRLGFFSAVGCLTGAFAATSRKRLADLNGLHEEAVSSLVRAVDARDPYTARHSEKVAEYAGEIAEALGMHPARREIVRWAALLHDVGKLALPEGILNKAGALTEDEWALIKRHPLDSVRILEGVERYRPCLPAIRHHHERVDGAGYPDGLRGGLIPLDARVLAIADAFDAMTSTRSYSAAMPESEALARIAAGAGTQFDAVVAAAFARVHRPREGVAEVESQPLPEGSLSDSPLAGLSAEQLRQ